jgi:hypothetical protein
MSQVLERLDICAGRPYGTEGKKNWIRVGEMTIWSDGGYSMRLDAVPTGNWFDGQLKCFKRDGDRPQRERPARSPNAGSSRSPMAQEVPFDDSDIPF